MAFETGSIIARFRSETKALLDGIRQVDRAIAGLKSRVEASLGGTFSNAIRSDFNQAAQTFRRQASSLSEVFRGSFAGIGMISESVKADIPKTEAAVRDQGLRAAQTFTTGLAAAKTAFSDAVSTDTGRLRRVVTQQAQTLTEAFRGTIGGIRFSDTLSQDFARATQTFRRQASSLSQIFKNSFAGIGLGFSESIRADLPRAVRAVRSQAQSLTQTFRSGIARIGTAFSDLVRGDSRRLGTVVREQARNVGNLFRRAIGSVSFSDQIESDIPRSQRLFQNLFTGIANQARNVSQILGQAFQAGLANVSIAFSDSIRADIPRARQLLNGFFSGIREQARSASTAIGSVFTQAFEGGIPTAGLTAFRLGILSLTRTVGLLTASFTTFSRVSRAAINTVVGALRVLQTAARQTFNTLRSGARALLSPFNVLSNVLQRSIFSLKNLLLVIGTVALVRRAKDVETLTIAFENLSTSVGTVADSLLRRLRAATRGTVSDLELMRSTNQAVLLNIVQSEEQFAELANVARRLGRAVGRDAVQALNDLALGIGRQSRLILDNLGLIVRVEEANRDYATQLGKTVDELSDTEKRQAFMNATMDAARRKVRELGPDIETTADAWDQFGAAVNNTIGILATEFVGGGLPNAISSFLNENTQRIRAFARFLVQVPQDVVASIVDSINRLDSGQIVSSLIRVLSNAFAAVADFIVTAFGAALRNVAAPLIDIVIALFGQVAVEISIQSVRIFARAFEVLVTSLPQSFKRFFPQDQLQSLARGEFSEFAQATLRDFLQFAIKPLETGLDFGIKDLGEGIQKAFEETLRDFRIPELEIDDTDAIRSVERAKARFERTFAAFQFDLTDPLANIQTLNVDRLIQPLANLVQRISDLRRQAAIRGFLINPAAIKASADVLTQLRNGLELTNRVIFNVRRSFQGLTFPEEELTKKLAPFEQALKKLRLETETLDLDPVSRELEKFNREVQNLSLGPEQAERVARLRQEFEKLRDLRVAKEAAQELSKAMKELNQQIEVLQQSQEGIELGEFVRQVTDLTNRFSNQAQFAERLSEALNELTSLTIRNFSNEARRLSVELDALTQDLSEGELQARELRNEWTRVRQTLEGRISAQSLLAIEAALTRVESKIREIARQEIIIGFRSDIQQQLTQTRDQFDQITGKATELDIQLRELGRAADEARDKLSQIKGTTEADLQAITAQAQALEIELRKLAEARQIKAAQAQLEQSFTRPFSRAVFGGLAEGLRRGQSAMETFADIGAQLFQNSMNQAVDQISSFLSKSLTGVFGEAAGAFGGIASGVLGAAGLILSNLESRTSQTIEDFGDQVSSSEAIRGVVAGPTNVAISAVGSQLKEALRTSEDFLRRIAFATESMAQGGGSGGSGPAQGNFVFPLTGSTT